MGTGVSVSTFGVMAGMTQAMGGVARTVMRRVVVVRVMRMVAVVSVVGTGTAKIEGEPGNRAGPGVH